MSMNNNDLDIDKPTDSSQRTPDPSANNLRVLLSVFAFVFFMIGVSFAAVPLYDLFCRVTGFGGTTQVAAELPSETIDRTITVQFNADTSRNMLWDFKPEARETDVLLGQKGFINYIAKNPTTVPITGTAIYNVVPAKAGKYFHKIQCFCFDEQLLVPQESMNMPVIFFIDPEFHNDPAMDDVNTVTLSYTFFKAESEDLDKALEEFYNREDYSETSQTVLTPEAKS